MNEWISAYKRLPPGDEWVLVCSTNEDSPIAIAQRHRNDWVFFYAKGGCEQGPFNNTKHGWIFKHEIEFWMPLPKLPER